MAKRFVPVSDPEKARCEQDEESLRKHRQFDTPFALLPKDLNNPREPKGDLNPISKRSNEVYEDPDLLRKKKRELFDKQQTWGKETGVWSNPEETRDKDDRKYKPGEVFWGAKGTFGGKAEDSGLLTLQRGEVDQAMELNEKGLWVRKKRPASEAGPGMDEAAKQLLKLPQNGEDPRLEAAAPKGRGTADAAKQALEALEKRRKLERKVQDEMGMTKRAMLDRNRDGPIITMHNSSQQVKPAKRLNGTKRWQGVHTSAQDAREVVEKAIGSGATGGGSAASKPASTEKNLPPAGQSVTKTSRRERSPSPLVPDSPSGSDGEGDGNKKFAWMDSDDEKEAAKPNSNTSGGDVVVDFF
eukprot:TRINITY_DN20273_c1_g2_i1.p1 TRINITY_DN20273_c1_g2~~TRINITY_DN20273_c1_g2_i1.p1  ORF type:complete len:356 (+),score=99.12 TRINITY_DN20273_c1_g2_i1:143-1210(+)